MRQLDSNEQERAEPADRSARLAPGSGIRAHEAATGFLMFLVLVSVVLIGVGLR
jgi:hypothetical protein